MFYKDARPNKQVHHTKFKYWKWAVVSIWAWLIWQFYVITSWQHKEKTKIASHVSATLPIEMPQKGHTTVKLLQNNTSDGSDSLEAHPTQSNVQSSNSIAHTINFFTGTTEKPYLVYCEKLESLLLPISKHFTMVQLSDGNSTLPPWNATALLIMDDKNCSNHAYVTESITRRFESPFVNVSNHTTDLSGEWRQGIYWPHHSVKNFMRTIKNRPALMGVRSEVFWRASYDSGSKVDFVWDRHTENPSNESFIIHYVQGAWASYFREYPNLIKGNLGVEETAAIYEGKGVHPYKPKENEELGYDKFCALVIRSDPTGLVSMFLYRNYGKNYDIDALVRPMFFKQLAEYKPCTRIPKRKCKGNPYTAYKCLAGSKFHITMENSELNGYISEKVFNGALGGGIPIYFGAPDIGSYINDKSIVHCNVNKSIVEEMRTFYPRGKKPRPFLFNRTTTNKTDDPTETELLDWADGYLRKELEPCVKRVIELDQNDTAFREVLREQFIVKHEILDGMYPLRGIKYVYEALRNWETISG